MINILVVYIHVANLDIKLFEKKKKKRIIFIYLKYILFLYNKRSLQAFVIKYQYANTEWIKQLLFKTLSVRDCGIYDLNGLFALSFIFCLHNSMKQHII